MSKANVFFPPYFAKRRAKMNKKLIEKLEESVATEPVASDEHGEYRLGIFLHRSCVVQVRHDDGLWSVQINSDNPITLPIIEEIRYKFIPDKVVMAYLFPRRGAMKLQQGVVLYEIPGEIVEDEKEAKEEPKNVVPAESIRFSTDDIRRD